MLCLNMVTSVFYLSFNYCGKSSVVVANDYVKNCNLVVLKTVDLIHGLLCHDWACIAV